MRHKQFYRRILAQSRRGKMPLRNQSCRTARLFTAVLAAAIVIPPAINGQTAGPQQPPEKIPVFNEFVNRVKTYVNLRSSLERSLPKPAADAQNDIQTREKALADKIVEARKD